MAVHAGLMAPSWQPQVNVSQADVQIEGKGVVFEVDASVLEEHYNNARKPMYLPPCDLEAESAAGTTTVRVESLLYVKPASGKSTSGVLVWHLSLQEGVCAWYGRWVGPCEQTTRISRNRWTKEDRWRGGECRSWKLDTHRDGDVLRLGLELLLIASDETMPLNDGRFQLGRVIGSGGMGSIHEVIDNETKRTDLIAKTSSRPYDVVGEGYVLQQLQGTVGFPELIKVCKVDDHNGVCHNVLVMQRLYRDLQALQRNSDIAPGKRFSPETVIEIGVQSLERLKNLHDAGLLHQDIKPENLMIDNQWGNLIYLIDFGIAFPWHISDRHVACATLADEGSKGISGTEKYCSADAHCGNQSRRSDLESLCYVLIAMATGSLPWDELLKQHRNTPKQDRYALVLEKKRAKGVLEAHVEKELARQHKLKDALLKFLSMCKALSFDETPDYDVLGNELRFGRPLPGLYALQSDGGDWSFPSEAEDGKPESENEGLEGRPSGPPSGPDGRHIFPWNDDCGSVSGAARQALAPHTSGRCSFTTQARTFIQSELTSHSTLDWQSPVGAMTRMARTCPAGHPLKALKASGLKDWFCDQCDSAIPEGELILQCKKCNYDVCEACAKLAWGEDLKSGFLEEALTFLGVEGLRHLLEEAERKDEKVVLLPFERVESGASSCFKIPSEAQQKFQVESFQLSDTFSFQGPTARVNVSNLRRLLDAVTRPPPSSLGSRYGPPPSLRTLASGGPPSTVPSAAEPVDISSRRVSREEGCFLQRFARKFCGVFRDNNGGEVAA